MKTTNILLKSISALLLISMLQSCKKNDESSTSVQLSSKITNIISVAQLDSLKTWGMVINEGFTPPNVTGTFVCSPDKLIHTFAGDSYVVGKIIDDYKYRFYSQVSDDVSVDKQDFTKPGTDVSTGLGSFLSGSGNMFTLFSKVTGVTSGIANTVVVVISGEISSVGIINFQEALIVTAKTGDANNSILIPLGKARIYRDDNGMASRQ